METLAPLLSHIAAGLLAGVVAGLLFRKLGFGMTGHILAGIIGGILCGYLANSIGFGGTGSAMQLSNIARNLIFGAIGGGGFVIFIGLLRKVFPPV